MRVLAADVITWYDVFCEVREFDKHVPKCKTCTAYYKKQALLKKVLDTTRV